MKTIYVFGLFVSLSIGSINGYATDGFILDEKDGKEKLNCLTGHLSSGEEWFKHDMGITSDWKHDIYEKHYPDGYNLEYLGCFRDIDEVINIIKEKESENEDA